MKTFRVKFNYHTYWDAEVVAETEEEAKELAQDMLSNECDADIEEEFRQNLIQTDCEVTEA